MKMTELLFRSEPYLRECVAIVTDHTPEGGVVLDKCIFYATGGGQPGDSGRLKWGESSMSVATTIKGEGDQIVLLSAEPAPLPPVGCEGVASAGLGAPPSPHAGAYGAAFIVCGDSAAGDRWFHRGRIKGGWILRCPSALDRQGCAHGQAECAHRAGFTDHRRVGSLTRSWPPIRLW